MTGRSGEQRNLYKKLDKIVQKLDKNYTLIPKNDAYC